MPRRPTTGREAVFRGKVEGYRVQGVLTKKGGQAFEAERKKLAAFYSEVTGKVLETVSDADVIEFMARGKMETRDELARAR